MNLTNRSNFDVLGLGAVTIDDLLYVESYPGPDAKVSVRRSERHCGGLTGTALVAASRLGLRTAYAGVLGTDELSTHLIQCMKDESVDMTQVLYRAGVHPIHAVIIVDETSHTRNVFVDLSGNSGADLEHPPEEVLLSTKVLFVDHIGMPGMVRAATICRAHGIPIVADFEKAPGPQFPQLIDLVDHLILSQSFALKITGESDPKSACLALWNDKRDSVVVTAGTAGAWYVGKEAPGAVQHQPAFSVAAVDTTGCGDVFHGAYAAALAENFPLRERIIFASATAALKATKPGGQSGIPNRAAVKAFLKKNLAKEDIAVSPV